MASRATGGSDEELAEAAAGGSRAAFEELVERYAGAVLAVLEQRVGDHHAALDLAQEAWVRAFAALPGFRRGYRFRPWLFSIALNAARDEGRRRARTPIVYLDDFRGHEEGSAEPGERSAQRAAIDLALSRVDEPFRTALMLVDALGLGYDEAAQALGCAVGTVKSRVSRGRLAFRDLWKRAGGEELSELSTGAGFP